MTHYYHEVPGRLRVKSPMLKGDHVQCKSVQDFLGQYDGVRAVSANPVTGSVVVNYDPKVVSSKAIKEILFQKGYFRPDKVVTSERYINDSTGKIGQLVGKVVLSACVEKMFEGSALSLITVLL